MPNIDLSILNQRQTPAFYADVFANRPAAGFVGRIFVSTDTFAFYRDNGTGWDLIGGPGTGTVTGTGAAGQVSYWSGASTITGDNGLFYDAVNDRLGIGTITPGAAIDAHSSANIIQQLNQTVATNNSLLAFQNSGAGLWRIGNFYNGGANDLGIFDVIGNIQPLTVKKTSGQVLIGTSTVGSGKLVVASASSDNGVQIVGASAPSLRIDNAETGPTKRAGLGISTAINNFIQGSADRDFCIFNGSTAAASPILFGVYNTGAANVQEAARISSAYNLLVGTTTDNGRKLQINGDASFATNGLFGGSNNPGNAGSYTVSVGVPGTTAGGIQLWAATNQSSFLQFGDGTASADNYRGYVSYNHNTDSLILGTASADRLTISSTGAATFSSSVSSGGYLANGSTTIGMPVDTGVTKAYFDASSINGPALTLRADSVGRTIRMTNDAIGTVVGAIDSNSSGLNIGTNTSSPIIFKPQASEAMRLVPGGNLLIGTTTDAGQKLQVNGSDRIINIISNGSTVNSLLRYSTSAGSKWSTGYNNDNYIIFDDLNSAYRFIVKNTGVINIPTIPTSAAGLSSGDIYSNAGILTRVP